MGGNNLLKLDASLSMRRMRHVEGHRRPGASPLDDSHDIVLDTRGRLRAHRHRLNGWCLDRSARRRLDWGENRPEAFTIDPWRARCGARRTGGEALHRALEAPIWHCLEVPAGTGEVRLGSVAELPIYARVRRLGIKSGHIGPPIQVASGQWLSGG
jgi:hypothetical protein